MDAREQIIAKIKECLKNGNQKYKAKAKIDNLLIVGNLTKAVGYAGWSQKSGWYIKLSKQAIEKGLHFILKEIVPHEVAHIVCMWLYANDKPYGDKGHGNNWKAVAMYLGASGKTKPDYQQTGLGYLYRLPDGSEYRLPQKEHDMLQKEYRVLKTRDGKRIVASDYVNQ